MIFHRDNVPVSHCPNIVMGRTLLSKIYKCKAIIPKFEAQLIYGRKMFYMN